MDKPYGLEGRLKNLKSRISEQNKQSRLNIAKTAVDQALEFAREQFQKHSSQTLEEALPNFRENYSFIQDKINRFALDIPRDEMPVIEPEGGDMKQFKKDLRNGHIDLFEPFAWDKEFAKKFPEAFASEDEREDFLTLGLKDGRKDDDVIKASTGKTPAGDLLPLQSQIWLGVAIPSMLKFGLPEKGSPVLTQTIIRSREGYILDGHHRFAQVMLKNPDLKMSVLKVPLDIDTLLEMGKSWSRAIGNEPKS